MSKERKYRTFQISGDSMLPIPDKSYVTGEYVLDWHNIHDKQAYTLSLHDALPILSKERKYRTFQISGDSMLPIPDKSYVTGEYVLDWHEIHDKQAYIILTIDDGIVFKIVENHIVDGFLRLHSLNPLYKPFEIPLNEIKEVWKFVHYISSEMPENMPREQQLLDTINDLKQQVQAIQLKLNI